MKTKFKLFGALMLLSFFGLSSCTKDEAKPTTGALEGTWELKKFVLKYYINDSLAEDNTLEGTALINELGRITWEFKNGNEVIERTYDGDSMDMEYYNYVLNEQTLSLISKSDTSDILSFTNYKNTGSEFTGDLLDEENIDGVLYKNYRYATFRKL